MISLSLLWVRFLAIYKLAQAPFPCFLKTTKPHTTLFINSTCYFLCLLWNVQTCENTPSKVEMTCSQKLKMAVVDRARALQKSHLAYAWPPLHPPLTCLLSPLSTATLKPNAKWKNRTSYSACLPYSPLVWTFNFPIKVNPFPVFFSPLFSIL